MLGNRILDNSKSVRITIRFNIFSLRTLLISLALLIICGSLTKLIAQSGDRVHRAEVLDQQGRFAEVVAILAPSLNPRHDTMNNSEIGVEWNLLGVAFENSGNYDAARRSYEESLRVLERLPDMKKQFASALDNLASLKSDSRHTSLWPVY